MSDDPIISRRAPREGVEAVTIHFGTFAYELRSQERLAPDEVTEFLWDEELFRVRTQADARGTLRRPVSRTVRQTLLAGTKERW